MSSAHKKSKTWVKKLQERHSWSFLPSTSQKRERGASLSAEEHASSSEALVTNNTGEGAQKEEKSAQELFFEALQQELCERVADVMLSKARARRGTEKVFDSAYREGCYNQVLDHVSQLQPRYVDHTPEEVLRHMYMISSVRKHTKNFDVLVTERSVVPGSTRQFSVIVVAVDRTKLLEDITEALLCLGEIADTDAMTTKDGIAFDNFLLDVPDAKDMDKKSIKSNLLRVLEKKIGQPQTSGVGMQKMKSLPAVKTKDDLPKPPNGRATSETGDYSRNMMGLGIPSPQSGPMYAASTKSESQRRRASQISCQPPTDAEHKRAQSTTAHDLPEVEFEDVNFVSHIQASVYDATYKKTRVAAKVLLEIDTHHTTETELLIVTSCAHPHIVTFIESIRAGPHYCMLFEFMEGGALNSLFKPSKEIAFLKIAEDITKGMCYLHSKSIVHRDLKSSNVLLDKQGNAKVTDFGVSKLGSDARTDAVEMTGEVGTYHYMAPEVIQRKPYTFKVDQYGFGVVMWEMAHKMHVWKDMTPMQAAYAVVSGGRPELGAHVPSLVVEVIRQCWAEDPDHRPSFELLDSKILPDLKVACPEAATSAFGVER